MHPPKGCFVLVFCQEDYMEEVKEAQMLEEENIQEGKEALVQIQALTMVMYKAGWPMVASQNFFGAIAVVFSQILDLELVSDLLIVVSLMFALNEEEFIP